MKTKYGKFYVNKQGYYVKSMYLHNLVWVNFYGKPVPKGYAIHHINGDKTDNRIQNLQCVKADVHARYHHKGREYPKEVGEKISKSKMGYHHTEETKQKLSDLKKGKNWTSKQREAYEKLYENKATISKRGIRNNKRRYALRYNQEYVKHSTNKEMLEMMADEMNHC